MTAPAHLLVVDDDERLRNLITRYLRGEGFRVTAAADAAEARTQMGAMQYDLIVLDVMMPGESGLEFASSLRAFSDLPVLMLTARTFPEDRIAGLEAGADDYLAKPFEPRELALRVRALLRRVAPPRVAAPPARVAFGPYRFDAQAGVLERDGAPVALTDAERAVLAVLARRPGEAISRLQLAKDVDAENERAVDVRVARLRRKIEDDAREPRHLRTVRGVGYALAAAFD